MIPRRRDRLARRLALLTSLLLSSAAGAAVELPASLSPADTQNAGHLPYRLARLTVRNPLDRSLTHLRLVPPAGGVNVLLEVDIPPGASQDVTVPLPAVDPVGTYLLTGCTEPGRELSDAAAGTQLAVSWPDDLLTPDLFLAPRLWSQYEGDFPRWSKWTRVVTLLQAVSLSAAGVLILAFRRRTVCLLAILLAGGVASAGALWMLRQEQVVIERRFALSPDREVIVLTARRPAVWESDSLNVAPVSPGPNLRPGPDDFVLRPDKGIRVRLHPRKVWVLLHLLAPPASGRPATGPAAAQRPLSADDSPAR